MKNLPKLSIRRRRSAPRFPRPFQDQPKATQQSKRTEASTGPGREHGWVRSSKRYPTRDAHCGKSGEQCRAARRQFPNLCLEDLSTPAVSNSRRTLGLRPSLRRPDVVHARPGRHNPVVGCNIMSAGCTNCYAIEMARRLEATGIQKYRGLTRRSGRRTVWKGIVREDRTALDIRKSSSIPRATSFTTQGASHLLRTFGP